MITKGEDEEKQATEEIIYQLFVICYSGELTQKYS